MASYDITTEVNELIALGVTPEEISACARRIAHYGNTWEAQNRASSDAFYAFYARKIADAAEDAQAGAEQVVVEVAQSSTHPGPRATDRQVAYIMSLIQRGAQLEGGHITGPTTRQGVAAMSKRAASAYIDSLTGN